MARRIILHVGAPKCGSTYLQRCLLQSRETLAAAGIAYPHPGTGHPGNGADIRDWDAGRVAALFAPGIHTAVISHEDLLNATKRGAPLVRLAGEAGITLEVLAFLRPFRDFIYGTYSQQMKQHFETWLAAGQAYDGQDFDAFCAAWAARYRPAGKLAAWAGMAAPGRFTLAPHDALRPTVEALLAAPGAVDWQLPHHMGNPSLRVADCEALARDIAAGAEPPETLRARFKAAFHKVREPDLGRTPARSARIEALYADENAEIRRRFGHDNRAPADSPRQGR